MSETYPVGELFLLFQLCYVTGVPGTLCYWVPSELSQHASVPGELATDLRRNILVELFTLSILLDLFPKIFLLIIKLLSHK